MAPAWAQVLASFLLLVSAQAWGFQCPSDCACYPTEKGVYVDCGGSAGDESNMYDIPRGFPKTVSSIFLVHHAVTRLGRSSFKGMDQLSELYLFANMIDTIYPQAFSGLKQLRLLDLSYNQLRTLNPELLLPLEASLQEIYLDGNPWDCTCSLLPLQNWVKRMGNKVPDGMYLTCNSPKAMHGRPLLELTEKDLGC